MPYCTRCQAEMTASDVFCGKCGAVGAERSAPSVSLSAGTPARPSQPRVQTEAVRPGGDAGVGKPGRRFLLLALLGGGAAAAGLISAALRPARPGVSAPTDGEGAELPATGAAAATGRADGVPVLSPRTVLPGHADNVFSLAFSPDGGMLASGSLDRSVRLWNTVGGRLRHTLTGHQAAVQSLVFALGGTLLAAGTDGGTQLWDAATGQPRERVECFDATIAKLTVDGTGELLAAGSGGAAQFIPLRSPDQRTDLELEHAVLAFSQDLRMIAVAGMECEVQLLDGRGSELKVIPQRHAEPVTRAAFSPDGRKLATADNHESEIYFWDIPGGEFRESLDTEGLVGDFAFSPDGLLLAVCSENSVRVWDLRTRKALAALQGHTESVLAVAFSPDGKLLATGGGDHAVHLWDLARVQLHHP